MTYILTTQSGRTVTVDHDELAKSGRIVGCDPEGRIVVNDLDFPDSSAPFLFGLTLCCQASDKGVENGVVCRACYDDSDIGSYLYPDAAGNYADLDPLKTLEPA